ncbi:MAG: lipoate--protein ligase family protein [bacterium]|nr:MAG: lipoate--protein ligase family protein [bacterium]
MDRLDHPDWYFWSFQDYSGDYNMMADHWLARNFGKEIDRPILRFYGWQPACISLGYHQNESDIDQQRCRNQKIDVVRRPTGGRAILHASELTYSVIYPYKNLDIHDFYRLIHIPFVLALQEMGIPASFEPSQADFRNIYKTDRAFLCFATSAKFEVEISGKKLIGSAQRVYENAILQHGSVLFGSQHQDLVDFLNMPDSRQKEMKNYMVKHTTSVWDYRKNLQAAELAVTIHDKFCEEYAITFYPVQKNLRLYSKLINLTDSAEFSIVKNFKPLKQIYP